MRSLVLTTEEKRRIIAGLKSSIIATRFMTARHLAQLAERNQSEIDRLEIEDPEVIEELLKILTHIEAKDYDYTVRREAKICLEILRKTLSSKYKHQELRCVKCNARLSYGWGYCPNCGEAIRNWLEDSLICQSCKLFCDNDWLYCVKCGTQIKEEIVKKRCPRCQRNVESAWLLCPYCGTQLR
jgi:predicted RNA-binding Zn-ribbon protein involved in translation (DUF1610 family)